MAVFEMTDKPHGKPRKKRFCCEVGKVRTYFKTKPEARREEATQKENNRKAKLGTGTTLKDLKKYTAKQVVLSYAFGKHFTEDEFEEIKDLDKKELLNQSVHPKNTFYVLWAFCRQEKDKSNLSLFDFNTRVAESYIERRLKEVAPSTVHWEMMKFRKAWQAAKKWPGLIDLGNPWEGITIHGATAVKRQRGLKKGELEKLIENCKGCLGVNKYYVPLAIYLAVETAMRRQEIFNLTWGDVDFENRRIHIRKSKTDWKTGNAGRVIVLPFWADFRLLQLEASINLNRRLPGPDEIPAGPKTGTLPTDLIFQLTGEAFSDAFEKVVIRAGIENLTFHDLRAAGEMNFYRALLSPKEIDIMKNGPKGHYDVLAIYLEVIQDKLDKYTMGKTLEDMNKEFDDYQNELEQEWQRLCNEGGKQGLNRQEAMDRALAIIEARPDRIERRRMLSALRGNHQDQSA
jgi:integrase